jgi:uncharacterized protein (DUF3820 family)
MILGIYDPVPFGKYKGELVGTVIEDDPKYARWLMNDTDLEFDVESHRYLKECE